MLMRCERRIRTDGDPQGHGESNHPHAELAERDWPSSSPKASALIRQATMEAGRARKSLRSSVAPMRSG